MKLVKKHRNVILRILDIIVISIAYYISEIIVNGQFDLRYIVDMTVINSIIIAVVVYSILLQIFKILS